MKNIILLSTFLLTKIAFSQSVLMTVNKDTIYTSVFEKNQKNSLEKLGVKQTINNYINFSLLKQYALGYKVNESQDFQIQVAKEGEKLKDSLYYPSDMLEPLLQDYYQKMIKERAVQILFFKESVLPQEPKKRGKFIDTVLEKINNKTISFQDAVEQYSSIDLYKDPVYLDVFSVGKFLVDAIYDAPVGKVTKFVSADGFYYLILVSKERKYLGDVSLDEIVIKDASEKGKLKADSIYNEIKKTGDFPTAKKKYSQNLAEMAQRTSLYTDLQNDQLYQYVAEVVKSNNPLDISNMLFPPIKTEEGYTIYEYLFRESYDTYSKARKKVYARLKASNEINRLNNELVERLKGKLDYHENTQNINRFLNSFPKAYKDFQGLKVDEDVLVAIGDSVKITTQDLYSQLKEVPQENYPEMKNITQYMMGNWENKAILDYYKFHFFELNEFKDEWKNLEDQALIKSALLIITLQAQKDVQGQKEFLQKESSKYTWKERIQGTYYYCLNSDVEKEVLQMLKNKKSADYINDYFKGKTDSDKNPFLVVNNGKFTREALNLPLDEKISNNKIYTADQKNRKLVIYVDKVLKDDKMSLEELQTTYINEYIDYKTAEIIEQQKKETKINIDQNQEKILENKYG